MSEAAETLGESLKAARERKGLSAETAAVALHLDAWVVDALESGDYVRIGPSVYVKGHLKRYAELLGLPAAEIIEAYHARSAPPPAETVQPPTLRTPAPFAARSAPRPPAWVARAAGAALAIAGFLWWRPWYPHTTVVPAATGTPERTAPSAAPTDEGPQPAGADAEREVADRAVETRPVSVAPSDADPIAGVGRARLRLSFSADSWVDVHDAAGRRLFAGNGRANSVKIIAGDAPMKVYLGFASGVQLEVNNRVVAIRPQFVAGDVARFEAGADGVLRRDARTSASNSRPRG